MAIAYRSTGTAAIASSKVLTLSPTPPAGLAVGDLMLMDCGNSAPSRMIQPAGWGTVFNGYINDIGSALFYKFATSADVAAANFPVAYTTSSGVGYACYAVIIAYSGVSAVRLIGLTYVTTAALAAGAMPTPPGAVAGEVVVGFYNYGTDASTTSYTLTYPTTGAWTQRGTGKTAVASTFNCGFMLIEKAAATDQPTGAAATTSIGMWINAAIILTPTTPTNPSPRTNKCTNPAQANDTTGWTTTGVTSTATRVTGATGFSRTTSYRLAITSTPAAGTVNKLTAPSITVVAGDRWAGSCELKTNNASPGKMCTAVWNWYTAGSAVLQPQTFVRSQITTTPQTMIFYGFIAPSTVATANIELSMISYDVVTGDQVEMSGVMYEQIYAAQPYFDGSSSGWVWDGTAGNSTSQASAAPVIPPGNWLPFMRHHDLDPELACTLITPKGRLWYPGNRNPKRRRVLDLAPARILSRRRTAPLK